MKILKIIEESYLIYLNAVIYDELTLEEHIEMTAMAYQLSREEAMRRAKPLLKVLD